MTTYQEYVAKLPAPRREAIQTLRELVKMVWPNIEETMHYRMPTYALDGHFLCAFASQKNYLALYIMPHDLLEHFADELTAYNCGKSCIRFTKLTDETLERFQRILEYAGKNYAKSALYGKMPVPK
ncbi:MAG: DUF1801 domain-containing protein [Bacteroidetes bacterium]|nr:MAG: DUF1801 domain-containing protein [Bacteroidota bacterium]